MATSVYPIHQAVGRPVMIKGLVGRYIFLAAGSLIGDLLLFILLYICGTPHWFCIALCFGLGALVLWGSYALSRKFGEHGLMKVMARKGLPTCIRYNSRKIFLNLKKGDDERRFQQDIAHPGDR
jgi:hypothetical protein